MIENKSKTKEKQMQGIQTNEDSEIDMQLYQKFKLFLQNSKFRTLKQKIKQFRGRNFPIDYRHQYNFQQQWEQSQSTGDQHIFSALQRQNIFIQCLCLLLMLSNCYIIWRVTVQRIYHYQNYRQDEMLAFSLIGVFNRVIECLIHIYLIKIRAKIRLPKWDFVKNIIATVYFTAIGNKYLYNFKPIIGFEILLVIHFYLNARKYYNYFKMTQFDLIFKYQFKIIDIMINLLIMTHFISLFLYASSRYNLQKNWVNHINIQDENYLVKYIYSFYFCTTSILTIGYGDISPKNAIQFFGVIIFGYMMNQIGSILSMRKQHEQHLLKNLSTLSKMKEFYNLESSQIQKSRNFIISNQESAVEFTPEEQNKMLSMLNQQLRNNIIADRSLSIIKSSIFFVCRWSKNMQNRAAQSLQGTLYSPNQKLPQNLGKQRIYIIKKGQINIYMNKYKNNNYSQHKFLKKIKINNDKQVNDNVYGYTAVISTKPCYLDALSSEFTQCFYIDKQQFLKCVRDNQKDLQYYHQIKNKMEQSEFCEYMQVPNMLNSHRHYNPSKGILIKKHTYINSKLINKRIYLKRNPNRKSIKSWSYNVETIGQILNNRMPCNNFMQSNTIQLQDCNNIDKIYQLSSSLLDQNSQKQKLKKEQTQQQDQMKIGNCDLDVKKKTKMTIYQVLQNQINRLNSNISNQSFSSLKFNNIQNFERILQYSNFFVNNNISIIVKRLQNENYNAPRIINTSKIQNQKAQKQYSQTALLSFKRNK